MLTSHEEILAIIRRNIIIGINPYRGNGEIFHQQEKHYHRGSGGETTFEHVVLDSEKRCGSTTSNSLKLIDSVHTLLEHQIGPLTVGERIFGER